MIQWLNAVPIDHHGIGKDGIKAILELLEQGQVVVVYPEGERTHDGQMHELRPGIQLLIKRPDADRAGGHRRGDQAWPRTHKLPTPAPLFLPDVHGLAVSVGQPLDAQYFAALPREQMLAELFDEMQKVQQRAERLRRKG